ncbi:MAG: FAD-dependent oxidoreductase [Pseudomonadota bacterium]
MTSTRRALLAAGAAVLAGCKRLPEITGGFAGASPERGHLLREGLPAGAPVIRRTQVVIAGGGIAGLAAARALRQRGIEDFVVLDLEDAPGGNSRGGSVAGIACPLGAHYLPVPGDDAPEVQALLEELGLRKRVAGRWVNDERHLCHSPQERLFFRGRWQEGLLPLDDVGAATLAQYRRFAQLVDALRGRTRFAIPASVHPWLPEHLELDALPFSAWLARNGLDDAQLRWYLDYCCRDDYGAGLDAVSAWAGLHYFAARHGFHVPGEGGSDGERERDAVFTWPEGNGFLSRALAAPLKERFRPARLVRRVAQTRGGVEVDAFDCAARTHERWQAAHCIVALPVFVAARVVEDAPAVLQRRAAHCRYAPWAVANLHLRAPLDDRSGAPAAWDNVIHGAAGLGYVVATHQSLDPRPGPTVLSWYLAPGEAQRGALLRRDWPAWRDAILAELSVPHPDLAAKCTRIEVARYGHAMAVPRPGTLATAGAPPTVGRLDFAHADWAGYSVFEEAFTLGHRAAARIAI